jgi:hypothetical protein
MAESAFDESEDSIQVHAANRGRQPALIESFGIRRLYGYRTISLSSEYAATILIARNGTGKTTLLGALDAFLHLQLNRLRNLEFSEIFCRIRGVEQEVVISHADVIEFLQIPSEGEIANLAGRVGISVESLFNFVLLDYESIFRDYHFDVEPSTVAQKIMTAFSYDTRRAIRNCKEVYESLFQRKPRMREIRATLTKALSDYEIVYLPTYRRVELALTEDSDNRRGRRRHRPKISVASGSLHTGDIQFGLSDILERLAELNREIINKSNIGYREISENIINELIRGFEVSESTPIPKPEDLKLFFARLETGGRVVGPYYPISPPDFERIYSGEGVPDESRKFLSYFLGKLFGIIRITKEIEEPVEEFVVSCNKYLSSTEPSTTLDDLAPHERLESIDSKVLRMNRTNLSVHVESLPYSTPISLDA